MSVLSEPSLRSNGSRATGSLARAAWRALAFILLFLGGLRAGAEEPPVSEYQIKAAFLVNFPKYVEWPLEAWPTTNSPCVITVLGGSKVSDELAKMVKGKTVDGHPLVLRNATKEEEITRDCHILFIGASEQRRFPAIREKLGNAAVLTVGESDDFLTGGGIINLAKEGKRISLEVNLTSTSNARLKISSKLLNVARVQKGKAP